MNVVNNFLPDIFFNKINGLFEEKSMRSFNWFWNNNTAAKYGDEKYPLDDNFMFTHVLWDMKLHKTSALFETFEPIIYFIDRVVPVDSLIRMKLNLYTNQNKKITHAKHYDIYNEAGELDDATICILNFTDCNGGTLVGDEDYLSKSNQAIIFDNGVKHCGYTQTDTNRRIVLNVATRKR